MEYTPEFLPGAEEKQARMRHLMTRYGLVDRSEAGLSAALAELEAMADPRPGDADPVRSQRVVHQLLLARCVLTSQRLRTESRGSHYRSDHPDPDAAQAAPIITRLKDGGIESKRGYFK